MNNCGTGGWSGPLPGDPDNNSILTATPAFGGIDVEWTYPTTNPFAVAHVELYRGTSDNFAYAVRHKIVSGNFFYDKIDSSTTRYYYWIKIVSVNGTVGDPIGPASAVARPAINEVIVGLTGMIDAGVLAQSLKERIDLIELNRLAIDQEMLDRAANDDALGVALNLIEAHSEETRALLLEEVVARTDANSAMVSSINTWMAEFGEDIAAAVQLEVAAQVDEFTAITTALTTAQSVLGEAVASVQTTMETEIESINGTLLDIGARWTAVVDVNGLVGGFGIYNDSTTVQAGFDVDTFWIGRTGSTSKKPFIVQGGEVFIDEAVINKLVFSKLRNESGSFVVENDKLKADFIDTRGLAIRDAAGNIIFGSGTALDYSRVGGTKPPANADRTASNIAAGIAGQGSFATLNQITPSNIATYIKEASIDTLRVNGNSVTSLFKGSCDYNWNSGNGVVLAGGSSNWVSEPVLTYFGAAPQGIAVFVSVSYLASAGGTDFAVTLQRQTAGGSYVSLAYKAVSAVGGQYSSYTNQTTFVFEDTPPAGFANYRIRCTNPHVNGQYTVKNAQTIIVVSLR